MKEKKVLHTLFVWLLIGNASWFSGLRKDWKWKSYRDWVKALFSHCPTHLFHLPYHCTDSFSVLSFPWSCNVLWMAGIGDGSLALTYSTRAISWASEVLNCLLNVIWQPQIMYSSHIKLPGCINTFAVL